MLELNGIKVGLKCYPVNWPQCPNARPEYSIPEFDDFASKNHDRVQCYVQGDEGMRWVVEVEVKEPYSYSDKMPYKGKIGHAYNYLQRHRARNQSAQREIVPWHWAFSVSVDGKQPLYPEVYENNILYGPMVNRSGALLNGSASRPHQHMRQYSWVFHDPDQWGGETMEARVGQSQRVATRISLPGKTYSHEPDVLFVPEPGPDPGNIQVKVFRIVPIPPVLKLVEPAFVGEDHRPDWTSVPERVADIMRGMPLRTFVKAGGMVNLAGGTVPYFTLDTDERPFAHFMFFVRNQSQLRSLNLTPR